MIQPRTLKGFRDYLPEVMIPRERLIERVTGIFRSFGFCPIDTPALEYLEILSGKGSEETDKQLYKFSDHGGREVGMRFDLTVPLARFTAQYFGQLPLPFKRYHIAKVWRGENTQAGRYREFMQCDCDTIGSDALACDIETCLVIHRLMESIDLRTSGTFTKYKVRINNRLILNGLLEKLDLAEKAVPVLRAIDKLPKIGPQKVVEELAETAAVTAEQAGKVIELALLKGSNQEILAALSKILAGSPKGEEGLSKLAELLKACMAAGVPEERLVLDVSIARGLDYYTGTIYETFLDELPGIGSVCSGGRYDDLAGLYTKQKLPGVGASLGLDRLLSGMEELGMIEKIATMAPVFIPYFEQDRLGDYLEIAAKIRGKGIGVEVFPEPKKLGQQLKYADKRGFTYAVIIGGEEFAGGIAKLKNLKSTETAEVPIAELCTTPEEWLKV